MRAKEEALVKEIEKQFFLSPKIKSAFLKTNREIFVPTGMQQIAYKLDALPLNEKQYISSPLTVAKMTTYLESEGADSVLEIGCGSGYQAAILSKIVRRVFSIERIENLFLQARANFKKAGIMNVITKLDDGQKGWRQYAPFDRILFSATAKEPPLHLLSQLADNGVMVFPTMYNNEQVIMRVRKTPNKVTQEILEECEFVPILDGISK